MFEQFAQPGTGARGAQHLAGFEQVQRALLDLPAGARPWADDVLTRAGLLPGLLEEVVHCDLFDGLTPPVIRDGVGDNRKTRGRAAG